MKAIILAAGKGTRLGNLTQEIPKPMLSISGKPLLEYIILYLKKNGIEDIGINLYTMSEQIVDYFKNGSKLSVNIFYYYEKRLSGTAGSLPGFEEWLGEDEDFMVIYGDILTNQPLMNLIELHEINNAFATLLLHRRKKSNSFVELDKENKIINFIERPNIEEINKIKHTKPGLTLVNSAVQILHRDVLSYVKKNNCFDLPKDVYSKVFNEKKLYGYELTGERVAIDSPERYRQAILNHELFEFD
jgi:mannose-1-phosphate guanylyltransferase